MTLHTKGIDPADWPWWRVVGIFLAFVGFYLAANQIAWFVRETYFPFDYAIPRTWPLKVFEIRPRPKLGQLLFFVAQAAFAVLLIWQLSKRKYPIAAVLAAGFVLVFLGNLSHSWAEGFVWPHTEGSQYWHDIHHVGAGGFLRNFFQNQQGLSAHGQTHPPGATLVYWLADRLSFGQPGLVSVWIGLISVGLTGVFAYGILRRTGDEKAAGAATLALLLVPAVQIYFIAVLDAVLCAWAAGFVYFLLDKKSSRSIVGMAICLCLFSFTSFAALHLIAVLILFEWIVRRDWQRAAIVLGALLLVYLSIYLLTGYNHLAVFLQASQIENPVGWRLLSAPGQYFWSRLACVLDLAFYLGPFVLMALWRGWKSGGGSGRNSRENEGRKLAGIALIVLGGMFLSGAFRVGETGRACLFLLPFLLPLLHAFVSEISEGGRVRWLAFVFVNALIWQLAAFHHW